MLLAGRVELPPGQASPGSHRPGGCVDSDGLEPAQVGAQGGIGNRVAGDPVTAAVDRQGQPGVDGVPDHRDDIGR